MAKKKSLERKYFMAKKNPGKRTISWQKKKSWERKSFMAEKEILGEEKISWQKKNPWRGKISWQKKQGDHLIPRREGITT
jgi:hypothetical protein